jgi:SAM-dependent methyltransferase
MRARRPPACPACDAPDSTWVMRHLDFPGVGVYHCPDCTVLWSHPRPSHAQLGAYYEAGRYPVPPPATASALLAQKRAEAAGQARFVQSEVPLVAGLDVLEIGCGSGFLLDEFQRRGARCVGVDLAAPAVAYARETLGLNVRRGDFRDAMADGHRHDLILLSHVFEHLPDPRAALAQLQGALRPAGVLFVEIPREDLAVFELKAARDYRYCSSHLFFYGPDAFRRLVTGAGLEVLRLGFYGPALTAFYGTKPQPRGIRRLLQTTAGRPIKRWLRPLYRGVVPQPPAEPPRVWDWNEEHADERDGAKNMRALLRPVAR